MTETSFYILFALQNEMHGYSIMQYVKEPRMEKLHLELEQFIPAHLKWKKMG
jgi:hypothetical protein